MITLRNRAVLAGAAGLVLAAAAAAQPVLSNSCRTWLFRNNTGAAADDIHIVFNGLGAGVTFVLENVVLPPVTSPNCPGYTWACGGGPVMDIFFAPGPIGPGQWVAVSVSTTGGFATLNAAAPPRWNFTPGGVGVVAEVFDPPTLVVSEVSTGAVDWIELANYGPSIDIGGYRVDVYEDPGSISTIFTFPTPYVLLTCHRIVLTDSAAAPVLGCALATSIVVPNIPFNLTKEGAVYVVAPPAVAGGAQRPVDGMAFGYFRDNALFHPDFPLPDAVQNYTDDDANEEQVTLYRMESCLRFAADSWHNLQVPYTILGPGGSEAHTSSATPGCPNPGECLTPFSCPGTKALTLRVSKCPLVVHVDGATPGAEVFIMLSTDLHATQSSGTLGGLNTGSSLLYTLFTDCFTAPVFRGPANLASPCGASARVFERNFGYLPGLPICLEISAYSLVRGQGGGAPDVQMLSNVVRIP